MKKKLFSLTLAAAFTLSAGSAMAMPLDFTGDFRLQGRVYDDTTGYKVEQSSTTEQALRKINDLFFNSGNV